MMKKLRLMSIAVAAALALSAITGCGSRTNPGSAGSAAGSSSAEGETSAGTGISGEKKPVTITFAEHVPDVEKQAPNIWKTVQAFMEKNPNVTIELTGAAANDHVNNMLMAAQSDTLPDIFWMRRGYAIQMAEEGYLSDLSPMIKANPKFEAGFLPGMLEVVKVGDGIYGIPCELQCNGIWYNKAIFDRYNLDIPTTFDEYLHCAEVLSKEGIPLIAKGMKNNMVWSFQTMLCRFGYYDKIDAILAGKEKWNNPDFLKLYEHIAELRDAGAFPSNTNVLEYWNAVELFLGGGAAMLDSGLWDTTKVQNSDIMKTAGFTWGPTFADGVGKQEISMKAVAHPFVVSKKAEADPDKYAAIMDFLQFMYGPEGSRIMSQETQSIPVTNYQIDVDSDKYPIYNMMVDKVRDDWESPALSPDYYLPIEMYAPLSDSIAGVITNVYTPEQALDYLDKMMQDTGSYKK